MFGQDDPLSLQGRTELIAQTNAGEIARRVPAPPRSIALRSLPWPVAIGVGAAIVVGFIALAEHWPPQPAHTPNYGAVALLFSPFLLWIWKIWREARILKFGDLCVGQVTSESAPLPFRDWPIQIFSRTRLRCVSYQYADKAGITQTRRALDWWIHQKTGNIAVVFTDPQKPNRSVLHGCCAVRVRGLDV